VDGSKASLEKYCIDKNVIFSKMGEIDAFKIVSGSLTGEMIAGAKERNLLLSPMRPEELYVYLTQDNKEDELKCLWKK